jgi:DNA-binding NarL/FixJ family response regulator
MDVLTNLARGHTTAEIAATLNLSEKTVGNYIGHMLEKLSLNNRVELAAYAYEHHIFERIGGE